MKLLPNRKTKLCVYCWKRERQIGSVFCKDHDQLWLHRTSKEETEERQKMKASLDYHWTHCPKITWEREYY